MKLLLFPLIILVMVAFLCQLGLGNTTTWSSNGTLVGYTGTENGWFDANDHLVMFANGTAVNAAEHGKLDYPITASQGMWNSIPLYHNDSGDYNVYGITGQRILPAEQSISFNLGTSLGLIAVVASGIILAGFIGTKIFGSTAGGGNDESASAIWKGTVLLTVWGIFSVLSMAMITAWVLGVFLYMFLTIVYCMGIINQIGHPGED